MLGLACGPAISLDASDPVASSSTGAETSEAGTQGTSDGSTGSTGPTSASPTTTDAPIDDLPPVLPGECPSGCEVDLPVTWAWDDEAPSEPALPPALTAMVTMPDGGWVVATQRSGLPWLTRLGPDGSLVWSVPASLSCDCEIIDLATFPSGQLAVLGHGVFDDFYRVLVLGRFDPDAADYAWRTWDSIYGTDLVPPRVGSVIPLDELHTAVIVVEAGEFSQWTSEEWTSIHYYEHDYLVDYSFIDAQIVSAASAPPRGVRQSTGELAMTLPRDGGSSSYVLWLDPVQLEPIDAVEVPYLPEVMAQGHDDALALAGHLDVSPEQLVLQVSGASRGQEPWAHSAGVLSTSAAMPAVTVDPSGSAIVAMRATAGTPEDPEDPTVALVRLHHGSLVWSTSVPLAVEGSPRPVAIASTDDGGLVLAGIVDERLHVERREQGCRCD